MMCDHCGNTKLLELLTDTHSIERFFLRMKPTQLKVALRDGGGEASPSILLMYGASSMLFVGLKWFEINLYLLQQIENSYPSLLRNVTQK